jgi:hypothetical protein
MFGMNVCLTCTFYFATISNSNLVDMQTDGLGATLKGKAIPVTGRGGPQGCKISRLPHFLDSRLTDGGEVVSLTCWPPFTPRKIPGTHIC